MDIKKYGEQERDMLIEDREIEINMYISTYFLCMHMMSYFYMRMYVFITMRLSIKMKPKWLIILM